MLGVVKRLKEPRFVKVEALQNLFGHLSCSAVINVDLRMKSRNKNRGRKGNQILAARKGLRVCDRKWRQ